MVKQKQISVSKNGGPAKRDKMKNSVANDYSSTSYYSSKKSVSSVYEYT